MHDSIKWVKLFSQKNNHPYNKRAKTIMPHNALHFQYQAEKNDSGLTGFAGLPLYLELAVQIGLIEYINQTIKTKMRGWTDAELILSLILLNLAGGD